MSTIDTLRKEADELNAKLLQSRKALDELTASGKESEQTLADIADEIGKLASQAEKSADKLSKAVEAQSESVSRASEQSSSLFLKTFGGGDIAEKFGEFGSALSLARNRAEGLDGASLSLGTRLKAGATAAGIAGQSIASFGSNAIQTIQHLRELAAQADETDRRVIQLGSTFEAVQQATERTSNASEIFALRQELLKRGIHPTTQDLAVLTRQMREYSIEMGGSATENTNQFLAAIESGNRQELANYGVSIGEATDSTQRFSQAVQSFSANQRNNPIIPRTETEALQAEQREIESLTGRISRLALQYSGIRLVVPLVEGAIERINGLLGAQRDETEAATGAAIRAQVETAREAASLQDAGTKAQFLAQATSAVAVETDKMSYSLRAGETEVDRMSRRLAVARDRIGAIRNQAGENSQIARQLRSEGFSAGEIGQAGIAVQAPSGGTNDAGQVRQLREQLAQLSTEARREGIELPNVIRRINETRVSYLQRTVEAEKSALEATRAFRTQQFETAFHAEQEQRKAQEDSDRALFESVTARQTQITQQRAELGRHDVFALASLRDRIRLASEEQTANDRIVGSEQERVALQERLTRLRSEESGLIGNESQAAQLRIQSINAEADSILRLIGTSQQMSAERSRSMDVSAQFSDAFKRDTNLTQTGAQSMAKTVMGAFNGIVSSIKSHSAALIEGRETAGEAFQAIAHEALLGLATESVAQAIFQTAAGIAALTNPVTAVAVAPQHFASAATYAAVAALAGLGAAATVPKQTATASKSTASASSANVSSPTSPASRDGGQTTNVFYIGGNMFAGQESMEQAVAGWTRGAQNRGLLPTG